MPRVAEPGSQSVESSHQPRRLGLIGHPVSHSLSPLIHAAAFAATGIDATYDLWDTPPAALSARIASLRNPGVLGANVTVPHKAAVLTELDSTSPLAERAGAVNTIVNRQGQLFGDNTDVDGFATALQEICPHPAARPALVLGAGGAARAVILALEAVGVERITVANRDPERARKLAADLDPTPLLLIPNDYRSLEKALLRTALLVNATSVGWHGDEAPFSLELLETPAPRCVVVDLTYRDTALLKAARRRDLKTQDGLSMLIHQAAAAFERWTGQPAPLDVMRRAAAEARAGQTS